MASFRLRNGMLCSSPVRPIRLDVNTGKARHVWPCTCLMTNQLLCYVVSGISARCLRTLSFEMSSSEKALFRSAGLHFRGASFQSLVYLFFSVEAFDLRISGLTLIRCAIVYWKVRSLAHIPRLRCISIKLTPPLRKCSNSGNLIVILGLLLTQYGL